MKLKSLLIAALTLGGLFAGHASAQNDANSEKSASPFRCTLTASRGYVQIGQDYSYTVRISFLEFIQAPPSYRPFTVVFFGSKDGVADIGPGGEIYPSNIRGNFDNVLGGYYNPGGFSGNYYRYALIYRDGQLLCSTNGVGLTLQ